MSSIINNIDNLLFESEIELDDKFIDIFEGKLKTSTRAALTAAGGAAAGVAAAKGLNLAGVATNSNIIGKGAELAKSVNDRLAPSFLNNSDAAKEKLAKSASEFGSELANSPVTHLAGIGAGVALGAGLLLKYKNSIMRANYLVKHYSDLAAKAKTPEQKTAANEKLKWAKEKLASAQAKARTEHKRFIEKSQEIKARIGQLNKAGDKAGAAKLQQKLDKRQKFLSKIGANI